MKNNKTHYRQGDVLIEAIAAIPANAKKQNGSKAVILAHGEVTGHHHQLETKDPADWWKEGEIATTNAKPSTLVGEIFLALPQGGMVTHQEHSTIELPAGNYRVVRQREYSPEEIRNVQD
jgi:hypothetical protein